MVRNWRLETVLTLTQVERPTWLLYELAELPKNSRDEGRVERS